MKVGDLVIMTDQDVPVLGVVVKMPDEELSGGMKKRVGVLWADGGGRVDWEPAAWLEVISAP